MYEDFKEWVNWGEPAMFRVFFTDNYEACGILFEKKRIILALIIMGLLSNYVLIIAAGSGKHFEDQVHGLVK